MTVRNARNRDRRISIQRATVTKSASNAPIETWHTVMSLWAGYIPLTGTKQLIAGQMTPQHDAWFRVLYNSGKDVLTTDRVKMGAQVFDIKQVIPLGTNEEMQLLVIERKGTKAK